MIGIATTVADGTAVGRSATLADEQTFSNGLNGLLGAANTAGSFTINSAAFQANQITVAAFTPVFNPFFFGFRFRR